MTTSSVVVIIAAFLAGVTPATLMVFLIRRRRARRRRDLVKHMGEIALLLTENHLRFLRLFRAAIDRNRDEFESQVYSSDFNTAIKTACTLADMDGSEWYLHDRIAKEPKLTAVVKLLKQNKWRKIREMLDVLIARMESKVTVRAPIPEGEPEGIYR